MTDMIRISTTIPRELYEQIKLKKYNMNTLVILGYELLEGKLKVVDQLKEINTLKNSLSNWQDLVKKRFIEIEKRFLEVEKKLAKLEK